MLENDESEPVLQTEIVECDEYVTQYFKIKHEYDKRFETAQSVTTRSRRSSRDSSVDRGGRRQKYKLPPIEFKKFGGEPKDWLPFWHQFPKIDEDTEINAADKIEYLIMATKPESRARRLVDSYPPVAENYRKIIDALKHRFGRDELQVEIYIRELIKQILTNANSEKAVDISVLYDSIEANIRALETMGIGKDNCAAILFPMIESCLTMNLLRAWQRSSEFASGQTHASDVEQSTTDSLKHRLDSLLNFLRKEVENEQRIVMATERLGVSKPNANIKTNRPKTSDVKTPSAATLYNHGGIVRCAFWECDHDSADCMNVSNCSIEEKKKRLAKVGACFQCARRGHLASKCRVKVTCGNCGRAHLKILCDAKKHAIEKPRTADDEAKGGSSTPHHAMAEGSSTAVFLQTLRIVAYNGTQQKEVRVLLDSGAQKSYICVATAKELGYQETRTESIHHALFGGIVTDEQEHACYQIFLKTAKFSCEFEVLGQPTICNHIPPIHPGPWVHELAEMNISLTDVSDASPIEVLIGADVLGRLMTGSIRKLASGLTAVETSLGWALMGKAPMKDRRSDSTLTVSNFLVNDSKVKNLWELDVLGIEDPIQKRNEAEAAKAAKELFTQTVTINDEGRYEVRLPWLIDHAHLPANKELAKTRFDRLLRGLRSKNLDLQYGEILDEWLREGIIEDVTNVPATAAEHYLPHRPVIKAESLTFKMRPVFDASAKTGGFPSLNECLEKGLNLIKLIPDVLLGFRVNKVGISSDIRKAFLQIGVSEVDRDVLRFLWETDDGRERIFRHRRVVFGITSSPFLLGATIDHHLERNRFNYPTSLIDRLSKCFYVDNCLTSVHNREEADEFRRQSMELMTSAGFDLRGWLFSGGNDDEVETTPVLGLIWHRVNDTLAMNPKCINEEVSKVTKRFIMSTVQRIFDPIGFTSPVTLRAKMLLQELWQQGIGWDDVLDDNVRERFEQWRKSLHLLTSVAIPRWLAYTSDTKVSVHTFCDASQYAYAAVIFLRTEGKEGVRVNLIAAKSRLAPMKKMTIPRLELMAATIASRLFDAVKNCLDIQYETFYWSDSTTVLAWLKRQEDWAPFVGNRVREIRTLTNVDSWRHVPGRMNPADLPSRGCAANLLIESQWWEGPAWLYERNHPNFDDDIDDEDEAAIVSERKKKPLNCLASSEASSLWHLDYFSKYLKTVRMIAWIRRFVRNAKCAIKRIGGELSVEEIEEAEIFLFKVVQNESFGGKFTDRIKMLSTRVDDRGLMRIESRMSARVDTEDIRFPIVLPGDHAVARRMIFDMHKTLCHVGVLGLLSALRERFWIVGGRRAVRSAISKCVICKRYSARKVETDVIPLPRDRVRDAIAFEVVGIDFAGPLYARDGNKVWICLFTCAVYRAVHLELTGTLSSAGFIQVLRRFIARRGRPTKIISDNEKNFVGTERLFAGLEWERIREFATVNLIEWVFNPPSAPWWGGFWERLVAMTKTNLRKVLGRASLQFEELYTILCDCESVLNNRPLTAPPTDSTELRALTPQTFLRELAPDGVPDCDQVEKSKLCQRAAYLQKLRDCLRRRFRTEYLGQLRLLQKKKTSRPVEVGQLMLLGDDNVKRYEWPLVRVVEIYPSKDGQVRVVKVRTAKGTLVRPVQRLYSLECDIEDVSGNERHDPDIVTTRSGRSIKKPDRLLC